MYGQARKKSRWTSRRRERKREKKRENLEVFAHTYRRGEGEGEEMVKVGDECVCKEEEKK